MLYIFLFKVNFYAFFLQISDCCQRIHCISCKSRYGLCYDHVNFFPLCSRLRVFQNLVLHSLSLCTFCQSKRLHIPIRDGFVSSHYNNLFVQKANESFHLCRLKLWHRPPLILALEVVVLLCLLNLRFFP